MREFPDMQMQSSVLHVHIMYHFTFALCVIKNNITAISHSLYMQTVQQTWFV